MKKENPESSIRSPRRLVIFVPFAKCVLAQLLNTERERVGVTHARAFYVQHSPRSRR